MLWHITREITPSREHQIAYADVVARLGGAARKRFRVRAIYGAHLGTTGRLVVDLSDFVACPSPCRPGESRRTATWQRSLRAGEELLLVLREPGGLLWPTGAGLRVRFALNSRSDAPPPDPGEAIRYRLAVVAAPPS